MKNKNVIIASVAVLAVTLSCMTAIAATSDNEVAKVPVVNADVPLTTELPFLYSQYVTKVTATPLTNNVQKDGVLRTVSKAVSPKTEEVKAKPIKVAEVDSEAEEDSFEAFGNIPLNKTLQKKIADFAEKKDIPVTLVFAMMKQESSFNSNEISDTHDYGIMQINHSNFNWLTEDLKEHYDIAFKWDDSYISAVAGIHYLDLIRDSWEGKGIPDEELLPIVLLCYNMGTSNAVKDMKHHDPMDWTYVRKIVEYKEKIEMGESL